MIMQAVISYPVEVLCTQTHDYTDCDQISLNMLSWSSIGTQTHDCTGCCKTPVDMFLWLSIGTDLNPISHPYQMLGGATS